MKNIKDFTTFVNENYDSNQLNETLSEDKKKAEKAGAVRFLKKTGQILEYNNGNYLIELDEWVPLSNQNNGKIVYKQIKSCNGCQIKFEKNGYCYYSVWKNGKNLEDRITSLKRAEEICKEMK
jgi:hypothetical protein